MIMICEPQCKGMSHEKVNSGFIYGLRLAYPQEKIVFFAEVTHIRAIQDIFAIEKVIIDDFECRPIKFNGDRSYGITGMIRYYLLFRKIFSELFSLKVDKIFFLSSNPIILYTVKKIKQRNRFKDIGCTFVLHGELEEIAENDKKKSSIPIIEHKSSALNLKVIGAKIIKHRKKLLPYVIGKIFSPYTLLVKKLFNVKKIMMWGHSDHYKYIALSPHVVANAKKYLDTDYLNFHTIIMPIIFSEPKPQADNQFMKFAVFGYGDSVKMHEMLSLLSEKKISKPYEIRIISTDDRGTEGFPNVRCVSRGRVMDRKEMESYLPDIDVFMNLYDSTRHKLGCSLSIFEALSYLKPVLHLSNDGYNYFNKPEKPIGFRCENMNEYVEKMCDMIENYDSYKNKLSIIRNNMLEYRKEYAIENNLPELKKGFTFN